MIHLIINIFFLSLCYIITCLFFFTKYEAIKKSNNSENNWKNICGLAVAKHLGCENNSLFLHYNSELTGAILCDYNLKGLQVEDKNVYELSEELFYNRYITDSSNQYLIFVENHVLLLDFEGNVLVDTAPELFDNRKIISYYLITPLTGKWNKLVNVIQVKMWIMWMILGFLYFYFVVRRIYLTFFKIQKGD